MSKHDCPQQSKLVALIRDGSVEPDIEACREVARVIRALGPLAARSRELPPATVLYWRAQAQDILGESNRRRWRAVRPLRYFHLVVGIGLVAAALLVAVAPLIEPSTFGGLGIAGALVALLTAAAGAHLLSSRESVI